MAIANQQDRSVHGAGIPVTDFARWWDWKQARYESLMHELVIELKDPTALTAAERRELLGRIQATNMAIYAFAPQRTISKNELKQLGRQLGLHRLDHNLGADHDGVTRLRTNLSQSGHDYIPYSGKQLNWHTDGYYNHRQIRAFLLHCCQAAASGGDSRLLDHEVVYALLRADNPDWVAALMEPDVMTIPANILDGREIRPEQSGPVFSALTSSTGCHLHMRYTARKRYIHWKQSVGVLAARRLLEDLLASDTRYTVRHRLEAGQGLLCNNVLHARDSYQDNPDNGPCRLVYRARYYDRIHHVLE